MQNIRAKHSCGIVVRSYNKPGRPKEEIVKDIQRAVKNAAKLLSVEVGDKPAFARVMFAVPVDHDFGGTAELLSHAFAGGRLNAEVLEVKGHHSCQALNEALGVCAVKGIDYGIIVSGKAIDYVRPATLRAMLDAFDRGAKVVGVATDELVEGVKEGRVQNTFCGWDLEALFNLEPPGFDSSDGVEEYAPAARLIKKHGACVAVLIPFDLPPLDIRGNADGKARHEEVMRTKMARQQQEAVRVGADFAFVKVSILPGYPKTV